MMHSIHRVITSEQMSVRCMDSFLLSKCIHMRIFFHVHTKVV